MRYTWTEADPATTDALNDAFERWGGTPYESGQAYVGLGADCIGAVFGVILDVTGHRFQRVKLPADTAMHDKLRALEAMRSLLAQFPHVKVTNLVKPGDIVVMTSLGGGPQHVGIVGTRRNTMWHAIPGAGFRMSGLAAPTDSMRISAVYRILQ